MILKTLLLKNYLIEKIDFIIFNKDEKKQVLILIITPGRIFARKVIHISASKQNGGVKNIFSDIL